MELKKREEIIKALECCSTTNCTDCPYTKNGKVDIFDITCSINMAKDTLSFIKELTEENEYLKQQNEIYEVLNKKLEDACESYAWTYGTAVSKELFLKRERVDTVHKMQKMFGERLDISTCGYSTEEVVSGVLETLDRVAEEILEGKNDV